MIAIALACGPRLLFADEPTTALDVTVQAQILDLLEAQQTERHMAMVLITHDLGVVAGRADDIAVMYAGKVVEKAPTSMLFAIDPHAVHRGAPEVDPQAGEHAAHPAGGHPRPPAGPRQRRRRAATSAPAAPTPSPSAIEEEPPLRDRRRSAATSSPAGSRSARPRAPKALEENLRGGPRPDRGAPVATAAGEPPSRRSSDGRDAAPPTCATPPRSPAGREPGRRVPGRAHRPEGPRRVRASASTSRRARPSASSASPAAGSRPPAGPSCSSPPRRGGAVTFDGRGAHRAATARSSGGCAPGCR